MKAFALGRIPAIAVAFAALVTHGGAQLPAKSPAASAFVLTSADITPNGRIPDAHASNGTDSQVALPPIRPLGGITETSRVAVSAIASIRPLSDGRVMVNDKLGRQVVLFDSSLARFTVVADTTRETAKAYGVDGGALFGYYGDSSLFGDVASLSLLVIDPNGRIVRVIAAPRTRAATARFTVQYMIRPEIGGAFDGRGNIVLKPLGSVGALSTTVAGASAGSAGPPTQDSSVILRANILTNRIDTVARLLAPAATSVVTAMSPTGAPLYTSYENPMRVADTWAVMADGTIAVIRELDYHIDWYALDGTKTSSPRIQHQWERLTDSMKIAIIDSAKRADSLAAVRMKAVRDSQAAAGGVRQIGGGPPGGRYAGRGAAAGVDDGAASGSGTAGTTTSVGAAIATDPDVEIPRQYVDPSDLPDYLPPFLAAFVAGGGRSDVAKVDADGNLWIRANQANPLPGGPVFDVVSRAGTLIDRVQIPGGTTLVGFGPGAVYLTSRVGTGTQLARARIH